MAGFRQGFCYVFGDCRSPGIGKSVYKGFHLEFPHACFLFHFGHIPFQQIAMGEFLKKNFFRLLLPVVLWHIISMCSWDPIFYYVTDHSNWLSHYVQAQVDFITGNICGFGWFMIAFSG